jgi:hypothetical protein
MADQIAEPVIQAFRKVSRLECELVKALEDLSRTFEEAGIEPKTRIQSIIDQLDDHTYDLESEVEESLGVSW